ncbi:MAG: hypothetical protein HY599_02860 [Candidatus Omnitrophica bacterium]|nr:hypothetical protein [Candidatus Omnitrophota bacterium]
MIRSLILKLIFLVGCAVLAGLVFSAFLPSKPRPRTTRAPRSGPKRVRVGVGVSRLPLAFIGSAALAAGLIVAGFAAVQWTRDALRPVPTAAARRPHQGPATPNALWALAFERDLARWQADDPRTQQPVVRVPATIVSAGLPLSVRLPITGGIPFPMGQLSPEAPVRLADAAGTPWPIQTRPLATWEDGSVKWLLVTTQVPPSAVGRNLFLDYGASVVRDAAAGPRVDVTQTPDAVVVTTGPLRFTVSRTAFTFFESAAVDRNGDRAFSEEERLASRGDLVVRHRDIDYRSSLDRRTYRLEVEEAGPLRATLKASGWFRDAGGKGFCRFIVRFQAFAGLPQVRVYHTFIYTGYPENRHHEEYRGLTLPENETIQEIRIELPVDVTERAAFLSADEQGAFTLPLGASTTITQYEDDAYRLRGGPGQPLREGSRHEGWLLAQNARAGVMVQVRDAWQQYPKELAADPAAKRLVIKLWPESAGALDLKTGPEAYGPDERARGSAFGLGKTHELMVGFLGIPIEETTASAIAQLWREPWLLFADPAWHEATKAWGPTIGAAQPEQFPKAEQMLVDLFGWAERQPRDFRWYGMLDYGDTLLWYRKEAYDKSYDDWGWHPDGRWGWHNCEAICTHGGVLTSFIRTGELPYFQFGEAHARHVMDVDTVHHNTVAQDPRLKRAGMTEAFSQVGSMHRHNAYHWGGRNEEATHTSVTGLLMYYYLTGDARAWDVINEAGGFFLRDPVTYRRRPHIAPGRAVSNVLLGDLLMYQATWDPRYWRSARRWARVLLRGQRPDGGWPETYNPLLRRWRGEVKNNYMALHILPALIAYHRLTGDGDAARAITRGADWLAKTEPWLPFFDALAYSYLLTGQRSYLDEGTKRLNDFISVQRHVKDPLMDGMIFQRPIYDNVGPTLYAVPFMLGAMDAPDFATLQRTTGLQALNRAMAPSPGMATPKIAEPRTR